MKHSTRKILTICVALAVATANTFLAVGSIIGAHAQSSLASGISSLTTYSVPGSDPWGTAFDSSGHVWVAIPGCDPAPSCSSSTPPGKLGLFDPNGQNWVTIVSLPTGYGQPIFVAVDHTGKFHEVATPASNSQPYGITVDTSDNIWFTENPDTVALIGEYTSQGVLNEYKIRNTSTGGTGLTPHLIIIDHSGNVWWSEGFVGAIARLNVAAAQPGTNNGVTEYPYAPPSCSNCGTHTSGISADSQGLIWLDDSLQNDFGSLPVGGARSLSIPRVGILMMVLTLIHRTESGLTRSSRTT